MKLQVWNNMLIEVLSMIAKSWNPLKYLQSMNKEIVFLYPTGYYSAIKNMNSSWSNIDEFGNDYDKQNKLGC